MSLDDHVGGARKKIPKNHFRLVQFSTSTCSSASVPTPASICLQLHWQLHQTPLAHHCVFCKSFQRDTAHRDIVCHQKWVRCSSWLLEVFIVVCLVWSPYCHWCCVICFIFLWTCMILNLDVLCCFHCFDVCRFVHVIFVCCVCTKSISIFLFSRFNIFVLNWLKSISMFCSFLISIIFCDEFAHVNFNVWHVLVSFFVWICGIDFVMCFKESILEVFG